MCADVVVEFESANYTILETAGNVMVCVVKDIPLEASISMGIVAEDITAMGT